MIPRAQIAAWRRVAPWSSDAQMEQDLVIARALVEIYSDPELAEALAFRGGTALHKLYLQPPARYSEDIDLVQVKPGAIGPVINLLRRRLAGWLGEPKREQSEGRMTLIYRFDSEIPPITPLRLKIEVNTREHFTLLGLTRRAYSVDNPWFSDTAELVTYHLEELLGTKLRAFYQRKKGRDLFDLATALHRFPEMDQGQVVQCFLEYMRRGGTPVTRAEFEANLEEKLADRVFHSDIQPLLAFGDEWARGYETARAAEAVHQAFITQLPGTPWKGKR